jgi:predicted metal-dependent hydrolase
VLAPIEVLDYVVVHELLHVKEPNHSRDFWRLLDLHRPGWQQQAEWLRTHGPELLAFETAALVPTPAA